MDKPGYIYIVASQRNGTIYTGVTSDLPKRIHEHRNGLIRGFTRKYGCKLLVWYQAFDDLDAARHRELQIKEWKRAWKLRIIEEMNPDWKDLYDTLWLQRGRLVPRRRPGPSRKLQETGSRLSPGNKGPRTAHYRSPAKPVLSDAAGGVEGARGPAGKAARNRIPAIEGKWRAVGLAFPTMRSVGLGAGPVLRQQDSPCHARRGEHSRNGPSRE